MRGSSVYGSTTSYSLRLVSSHEQLEITRYVCMLPVYIISRQMEVVILVQILTLVPDWPTYTAFHIYRLFSLVQATVG
jgi:hypothetical protein